MANARKGKKYEGKKDFSTVIDSYRDGFFDFRMRRRKFV